MCKILKEKETELCFKKISVFQSSNLNMRMSLLNARVETRMAILIELFSVILISFGMNLIPFASPSNLLIASNAALLVNTDPLSIGVLVALGATCAKLIHYAILFFIGKHVGEERRRRLDAAASKMRRWAFLAVFIAAATPIPDEPVIVPLGLTKYNPGKFSLAFFSGKFCVAVLGAYLGGLGEELLSGFISQVALVVISIVLTIVITVILLRVDLSGIAERILKKLGMGEIQRTPQREDSMSSVRKNDCYSCYTEMRALKCASM
jgi:membrane protein DedA with SNARE-associated domain